MLRLTESTFRGQVLRAHMVCVCESGSETNNLCVLVCVCPWVYTIDMEPVMWRSDHELGSVPLGIISQLWAETVNFPTSVPQYLQKQSSLALPHMWMTPTEAKGEMVRFLFFLTVTWAEELSPSHHGRGSYCLSESLGFLTRGWTLCMVQGPWNLSGW